MSDWRLITLGDVCTVQSGFAFKSRDWAESGVPVVKIQNVRGGRVDLTDCSFVPPAVARTADRYRLARGDVLITMSGEIGSVGVVRSDVDALLNQRVGRVRLAHEDPVLLRFIGYALQCPALKGQMENIAYGVAQPNISPSLLASLPINLPPRESQRIVGEVLATIDDLIDNNRRRVEVLEEMARSIYREWFVRFRYPGHEKVALVDSALGQIPDGWRVSCVEQLVTVSTTTVDPTAVEPATPAVGLEHIPRRQLTLDDWGEAGELGSRKAMFAAGDILFGKIRPYFHKVSVAPLDGICSTDAMVMRPHEHHWGQAVLSIASDEFVAHAVQTSNGTKMPRADWKVIREFPVAVPPVDVAIEFSHTARSLLGMAQTLMFQARQLTTLRDLLLPKLVSGQIDVSHLDLDALTEARTA